MRVLAILGGGCMAASFVIPTALSAQMEHKYPADTLSRPAQHRPATAATKRGKPKGVVKTTGKLTAAPLTKEECFELGGSVVDEKNNVCLTGLHCRAVDQEHNVFEVCITER